MDTNGDWGRQVLPAPRQIAQYPERFGEPGATRNIFAYWDTSSSNILLNITTTKCHATGVHAPSQPLVPQDLEQTILPFGRADYVKNKMNIFSHRVTEVQKARLNQMCNHFGE